MAFVLLQNASGYLAASMFTIAQHKHIECWWEREQKKESAKAKSFGWVDFGFVALLFV